MIRFIAWVGGITAGAQIASGVVRGASHLLHGKPGSAFLEVADGLAAPVVSACYEVSNLGHEIYSAITRPWKEKKDVAKEVEAPAPVNRLEEHNQEERHLLNSVPTAVEG